MRSFTTDNADVGEFITPHELNNELREVVTGIHRIDRDNFGPNELPTTKIALGAWGDWFIEQIEEPVDIAHQPGDNSTVVYPIPHDDSGGVITNWVVEFSSGDCELMVTLAATWEDQALFDPTFMWIGAKVDGILIMQSPIQMSNTYVDHALVWMSVPVGAGTHVVEFVYGMHDAALGFPRTITWLDRMAVIREIAR